MFCKNCGKELIDGMSFCGYCGKRVEKKLQCPNCGTLVDDKYSFCLHCGTPLASAESQPAPAKPQVQEAPVAEQSIAPAPVQAPVAQPAPPAEKPAPVAESKPMSKLSIAENIVSILGVLIAMSFSIVLVLYEGWDGIEYGDDYRYFSICMAMIACILSAVFAIIAAIKTLSGGKAPMLKKFTMVGLLSHSVSFLYSHGSTVGFNEQTDFVHILGCILTMLIAIAWIVLVIVDDRDRLFQKGSEKRTKLMILALALSVVLIFLTSYSVLYIYPNYGSVFEGASFTNLYSIAAYIKYLSTGVFQGDSTAEAAQFFQFAATVLLVILPTALVDNLLRGKDKGLAFASPIFAFSLLTMLLMYISVSLLVRDLESTVSSGMIYLFMFVIQFACASALWAITLALTIQKRKSKLAALKQ